MPTATLGTASRRVFPVLAGVMALALLLVSPAQGAGLDKKSMKRAGLRISDIPASFSKDPSRSVTYGGGSSAESPDLCHKPSGAHRLGRKPMASSHTEILLETPAERRYKGANSFIFEYKNPMNAKRAFRHLRRQAKKCPVHKVIQRDDNGAVVNVNVDGRYHDATVVEGTRGFTLDFDLDVNVSDVPEGFNMNLLVDKRTTYYLCGAAIIAVDYARVADRPGSGHLKPNKKRFVDSRALTVTQRVGRAQH